MTMPLGKPITLLLVEDDEADIMAMRRALASLRVNNPVVVAYNGLEALEHLRGENGREHVRPPCIVLLDLNMPRMGGIEFLEELRKDEALASTVVFVLTTSADDADKVSAYGHHVAGYVVKSDSGTTFMESVKMLQFYWTLMELPPS